MSYVNEHATDTLLITLLSELDHAAATLGSRLDALDHIHPDWAEFCSDDSPDLTLHPELTDLVTTYYDLVDHFAPHRPLYTCALVRHGRYSTQIDYTIGY